MCSVSITGDIVITILELSETKFFLTELKYCGNYACQLWKLIYVCLIHWQRLVLM